MILEPYYFGSTGNFPDQDLLLSGRRRRLKYSNWPSSFPGIMSRTAHRIRAEQCTFLRGRTSSGDEDCSPCRKGEILSRIHTESPLELSINPWDTYSFKLLNCFLETGPGD